MIMFGKSAKGAARTNRLSLERIALHSVLREFLGRKFGISLLVLVGWAVAQAPAQQPRGPATAAHSPRRRDRS